MNDKQIKVLVTKSMSPEIVNFVLNNLMVSLFELSESLLNSIPKGSPDYENIIRFTYNIHCLTQLLVNVDHDITSGVDNKTATEAALRNLYPISFEEYKQNLETYGYVKVRDWLKAEEEKHV